MFTSINDIKINTAVYLEEYKKNFDSLIHQKEKDRSKKVEALMEEIKEKQLFNIEGSDEFKDKINANIKALLQVKPGRVLIKELIQQNTLVEKSIPIKSGEKAMQHTASDSWIEINLNSCPDHHYNVLAGSNQVKGEKPSYITLAHELMHELHEREEKLQKWAIQQQYWKSTKSKFYNADDPVNTIEIYPNPEFHTATFEGHEGGLIFKDLDTPEEQHTILGINVPRYLKKKKLSTVDVLCENAFLMAFNLLPRKDHQLAKTESPLVDGTLTPNNEAEYYNWIFTRLNERNGNVDKVYSRYL